MMQKHSLIAFAVAATLMGVLPTSAHAQSATPASATEENAQARALFRQGATAMKDGKYAEARKYLLQAWALRRTYDVAAVLGQVELELRMYRDAAEHLDFAIRNLAPRESAETLDKIKEGLQTAKRQIAEIRLSASEPGAELLMDGERVGSAPLDRSLFADVGPHMLEARLGSDRIAKQIVEAASGSAYTVELVVPEVQPRVPESGLAQPGPTPLPQTDGSAPSSRSLVPVYIGGGLTVAGLALGVGYRLSTASNQDDLDRLREKNGESGCADSGAADCDAQRGAAERVDSRRNISTVSFVVAGAAAVATAVYWFWPRARSSDAAQHRRVFVGGSPAPGGGSVVLFGSF